MNSIPNELVDHLCRHSVLQADDARRLIREVLEYYDETRDAFIHRRHSELKNSGLDNPTIYARIEHELQTRPFRSEPLSLRQIRRVIYG